MWSEIHLAIKNSLETDFQRIIGVVYWATVTESTGICVAMALYKDGSVCRRGGFVYCGRGSSVCIHSYIHQLFATLFITSYKEPIKVQINVPLGFRCTRTIIVQPIRVKINVPLGFRCTRPIIVQPIRVQINAPLGFRCTRPIKYQCK